MSTADVGRTVFRDGMRVAREHLEHLQDVAITGGSQARAACGMGKVSYGYRVEVTAATTVSVGPGLAFDAEARALELAAARDVHVDVSASPRQFLVVRHAVRTDGLVDGVPTLVYDDVSIELRAGPPPYSDDAVVFARLDAAAAGMAVTQLGDWYLPPLDHTHSGEFVVEHDRFRFDGHPLGQPGPSFDSGFVAVEAGRSVQLTHGLKTTDLVVQVQARRPDGVITTAGLGQAFWYELVSDTAVSLVRGTGPPGPLDVRVSVWPLQPAGAGPVAPIADAGQDRVVESGQSFTLDAGRSRSFGGRNIVKYIWTEMS
jgi:uncharacterized Zn-binding protein involved in type VI secretion